METKDKTIKISKKALALSATSLVCVLLFGGLTIYANYVKNIDDDAIIGVLDSDIGKQIIMKAFIDSIDDYNNGDVTKEEYIEFVINSLNQNDEYKSLFTDEQIEEMNKIIEAYLSETTIYPDIDDNEAAIKRLTDLLNTRYESNLELITVTEISLSEIITKNSNIDDERYDELVATDKRLQAWIDQAAQAGRDDLRDTKIELTDLIKELETSMNESDDNMYALIKSITGAVDYEAGIYEKGDYVLNDGKLYVSLESDNNSDITNTATWKETDIENIIRDLTLEMNSKFDDMQVYIDNVQKELSQQMEDNYNELSNELAEYKARTADYLDALEKNIASEDSKLQSCIDNVKAELNSDIDDTNAYINRVETALNDLALELKNADEGLADNIKDEESARIAAYDALSNTLTETTEELQNSINDVATTDAENLDKAKSDLTALIDGNSELDKQTKTELITMINDAELKTQADLAALTNEINNSINVKIAELENKMGQINNYKYELVTNNDGTNSLYITEVSD